MKQVSMKLTDGEEACLNELVWRGEYKNRSHAISAAIILLAEKHRMKKEPLSNLRYHRPGRRQIAARPPKHLRPSGSAEE